jgi:hypothetical protein
MSKAADPFNYGLAIYLEWGPAMATPIEKRLAKALPKLGAAEITRLIREFRDIQASAGGIVIDQAHSGWGACRGLPVSLRITV